MVTLCSAICTFSSTLPDGIADRIGSMLLSEWFYIDCIISISFKADIYDLLIEVGRKLPVLVYFS